MVDAKTCAVLFNELKTYSKHNGERDLQNEALNKITGSNPVRTATWFWQSSRKNTQKEKQSTSLVQKYLTAGKTAFFNFKINKNGINND